MCLVYDDSEPLAGEGADLVRDHRKLLERRHDNRLARLQGLLELPAGRVDVLDHAGRLLELDATDLLRQPPIGFAAPIAREMRGDPFAQVDALADVERQGIVAVEKVDAGRLRQLVERIGSKLRRQARDAQDALSRRLDRCRIEIAIEHLHECPNGACVAQRTMTIGNGQAVARNHGIEAVTLRIGKQAPRQFDRAQDVRRERAFEPRELVFEEPIVEARVVGDEDASVEPGGYFTGNRRKGRGAGHHLGGDAGQRDNRRTEIEEQEALPAPHVFAVSSSLRESHPKNACCSVPHHPTRDRCRCAARCDILPIQAMMETSRRAGSAPASADMV